MLVVQDRMGALLYIFLTGIILSIRPRELHLIPIEMRGSFEYYSFAAQKFSGLTYHTWLLLLYGLRYSRSFKSRGKIVFVVFMVLLIFTTLLGLADGNSVLWGLRSDIRWLIFLILGMGIQVSKEDFSLITEWILKTAFVCLLIYLLLDISAGSSKFDYSPDLVLVLPFLLFNAASMSSRKWMRILIPGSRTDMLLYTISWIRSWRSTLLVGFVVLNVFLVISSLAVKGDSFVGFIQRKSAIVYNLSVDKSSSVRLLELNQVLSGNSVSLLLGKGLGSYIDLNEMNISLDLADFSEKELVERRGIQPHFFITYLILKLGILGTLLFTIYAMIAVKVKSVRYFILYLGLLFGFYWIPLVAFIFGIVLRNGDSFYSRAELRTKIRI